MKKFLPEAVVLLAIILVVNYGYAQACRQTSAPTIKAPLSIASSADGRIIVAVGSAVPPDVSTNFGADWTTNGPIYGFAVASSVDGTKVLGVFIGRVFMSTNSGRTWNQTTLPRGIGGASCAASADGTRLVIANAETGVELIYSSTNTGTTWQTNDAPDAGDYLSLAASADGTKLFGASYGSYIFVSTNWGQTWSRTSATSSSWHSIASSADGRYLLATGDAGTAISKDSGSSWTPASITGFSAAASADGSIMLIGGAQIYTSTNFGVTWTSTYFPGYSWRCVASSADGCELVAVQFDSGTIWIRQAIPRPQMKITPSASDLSVSWIVPSTNFVLQQNSDLATTNWAEVTNPPTLNLTNLQDEVTLTPPASNVFFRLKTP
jgi:hypothetical protein